MELTAEAIGKATTYLAKTIQSGTQEEKNLLFGLLTVMVPTPLYFVIQRAAESYAREWTEREKGK